MAVKIEEVQRWLILKGIGHAVGLIKCGWSYTACGMMVSLEPSSETPKRICRRCRESLKYCNVSVSHEDENEGK